MPKHVYLFEEGNASMRDLLGGKGAGLAEMTRLGFAVPPGFTITTKVCNAYNKSGRFPPGMWKQVDAALSQVESKGGRRFGDPANPLLVSVRSGAKISMPGMMDTVLNIGLNDSTVEALAQMSNERFAWDTYRRLVSMYGRIVKEIDGRKFEATLDRHKEKSAARKDTDLGPGELKAVVADFKDLYRHEVGEEFPSDVKQQLRESVAAVFRSWNGKRAVDYRTFNKIPHTLGTAANTQMMVFGNMGPDSGTGVAFTRNQVTGAKELYGEYLPNAQGEDVVAGIRTPMKIAELRGSYPEIYADLSRVAERLENHFREAQDIEFTVERGKLWILQTRAAKPPARAAVRIALDMVRERLVTKQEALLRIKPDHVIQLLLPQFDEAAKAEARRAGLFLAKGLNASPGAAMGVVAFDPDEAERIGRDEAKPVILVRLETSPDDVHGILHSKGVLTARGGATSHAAVVTRGLGIPCVAGCEAIQVDYDAAEFRVGDKVVRRGEHLAIDGSTGEVFAGAIRTIAPDFEREAELQTLLGWADEERALQVWANADYPRDAARARKFGAQGIGLDRTEHMFMETDRLPIVQEMILAAPEYRKVKRQRGALASQFEAATSDRRRDLEGRLAELDSRLEDLSRRYLGSLDRIGQMQRDDFVGILREMAGLPVIIRLIDPPLHEFLPRYETLLVQVTKLRIARGDPEAFVRAATAEEDRALLAEARKVGGSDVARGIQALLPRKERLLEAVKLSREANPMLGLRGCRLGIMFPEITRMQVRAIFEAACRLQREGVDVRPEIMIPLVGLAEELRVEREALEAEAKSVMEREGVSVAYKFGTMIEIPRAALVADEIARHAEFFSFGTNDLTQTTMGYSRDDAEPKFLLDYIEEGILPNNPFQTIDRKGVGQLMRMCVQRGRKVRPNLEIGICGEHGGDPASIDLCHEIGLNYVSCSPFRVPVARLAAAHATLRRKMPASEDG
ncbi:MAG: pyruvate, phosphate dikinase [Methanobacteriota archaeon]|nr:MAG: pyruvate, phosphate dikinase [Euryarchaeota archaeon]